MGLIDDILIQPTFEAAIRNAVAGVKATRQHYDWVGIYLLEGDVLTLQNDHYLGLPTEHARIPLGSGLCGASATDRDTLVINDVRADSRYIACSRSTRSEMVVPILAGERIVGVLDLDSDTPAAFGEDDQRELEQVASALAQVWQAKLKDRQVAG